MFKSNKLSYFSNTTKINFSMLKLAVESIYNGLKTEVRLCLTSVKLLLDSLPLQSECT